MQGAVNMVEVWRGDLLESLHQGHAVIVAEGGAIVQEWGNSSTLIYPRSSSKMLQALPLIETGAADAYGLTEDLIALSCASHQGAAIHSERAKHWLADIGLSPDALRCGPQEPRDRADRDALIRAGQEPCQIHNNCSGKHCGFLTVARHLNAGPEYLELDHPVQKMIRAAWDDMTGETSPGYGIDGCSAPNFVTSLYGLGKAMAVFASAHTRSDTRSEAAARLTRAMMAYPELVAGEGRACTELMRAMDQRVAIKTGAEGVFVAIIPELKLGVALKIVDGATRAAEAAMAAILVRLGVLDAKHPAARKRMVGPITNRRDIRTGEYRLAAGLA